ncbi:MAG: hypothetical protein RL344_1094 [Pseudomonadota bacterium]|jgi:glutathione peroxidase
MIHSINTPLSIANFSSVDLMGNKITLSDYLGRVVLIVNTASLCGFTPQYQGLQTLYNHYKVQGFTVLAFPCNQFGGQEPKDKPTINMSCEIGGACDAGSGINFPIMAKINVNGKNTHPLYDWLKKSKRGLLGTPSIKWNFTKFLVKKDGTVFKRYSSITKPHALINDIEYLLKQ